MQKIVVYTAIFGGKDALIEPLFTSPDIDFVCFTDSKFESINWQIRETPLEGPDPVRFARKHKVLAHKLFPEYEYSIWVDGNIIVRGDVHKLLDKVLANSNMAVYDHAYTKPDSRDCIYEEARVLIEMSKGPKYKDDPELIQSQVARYKAEGYPEHAGLISSMELIRRHNSPDVVKVMEDWWHEIETGSRRDQLSFNYATWKNKFEPTIIHEDSRNNEFFGYSAHAKKDYFDSKIKP